MVLQRSKHQVYNDGVLLIKERIKKIDEFNTPLTSFENSLIRKAWYRNLSIYSNEHFSSLQMDTHISRKVAIRLFEKIGSDVISSFSITIDKKEYYISRVFHSYEKAETELTLVEVVHD